MTDTALGAIAEGFGAEAVAIARVDGADNPVISSRLPPSWEESSSLTFELHGQLWGLLERKGRLAGEPASSPTADAARHQVRLGDRHTWLGWQATASGDLAAAVVRTRPFDEAEQATLARLVRSVAFAIGARPSTRPVDADVSVELRPVSEGERWRAEAVVVAGGKRRRAIAEGEDRALAVARAAAKLCRVPAEVSFAGRTELDGASVTLVVVHDRNHAPFLGLAVTDPDRAEAPAEAVFSAVSAMDGPLGEEGGAWP